MDGLAEIIKLLEERLGPKRAIALLYLVALAVAAWAVHSIFVYVVVPSARLMGEAFDFLKARHVGIPTVPAEWQPLVNNVLSASIVALIYVVIIRTAYIRYSNKIANQIRMGDAEKSSKAEAPAHQSPPNTEADRPQ